ncbi:hypothetical protein, partial [Flavobacterium sp.]
MKKIWSIVFVCFTYTVYTQPNEARLQQLRTNVTIDATDTSVIDLLDDFYEQGLQSDAGELSPDLAQRIEKIARNKKTKNKHLFLLFMAYQDHISQTAAVGKAPNSKFQLELMVDLAHECKMIYNKIPAIVYVYHYEALVSNGRSTAAATLLQEALNIY